MTGPLAGMRVLDLTHFMAGPFCSMLLADMGADVVKVERPQGEDGRRMSAGGFRSFDAVNRNKRSIAVDLGREEGCQVVRRMAEQADVLVQNFRVGSLERMGLAYEDLALVNAGIIYCSISGFGTTGPRREEGGLDLIAQGFTGLMSVTGEPGRPPVKIGVPICDLNAGLFGALGILAAWAHRLRTGVGQMVDTSLMEGGIAYTIWESGLFWASGEVPGPEGSAHRLAAPYEALRTADGYITVGGASQLNWERICAALDRADLAVDDRFRTPSLRLGNRQELAGVLEGVLAGSTTAEWLARLNEEGVPCGPVNTIASVYEDAQVRARQMAVEVRASAGGNTTVIGPPVKLSRTPPSVARGAPALGEHTHEVLREYSFTDDEIGDLRRAGIAHGESPRARDEPRPAPTARRAT